MSLKHKAILKHIPNKHFQTTTNMYSTLQIISIVLLFSTTILAQNNCGSTCASNQVCVNLGQGYQCAYRQCQDIQCSAPNEVCIADGGVARCVTTSNTETAPASSDPCNSACTTSEVCVNLGQGYQCQPKSCSDLDCTASQVCINDGGVARCINVSAPNPCNVAVSVAARNGGFYVNNGVAQQIYDLTFTNTGSSPVSALSVTITPSGNAAVRSGDAWNLVSSGSNTYSVSFYNSLPATNSQYYGSGFVLSGADSQTAPVAVSSPTC